MRTFKNILITGGSGFIGSNFIKSILSDRVISNQIRHIINLDKLTYASSDDYLANIKKDSRYKFYKGDICDEKIINLILEKFNIDAVINFAAESHVDNSIESPDEFVQTNIYGTFNLLKCINKRNKLQKNEVIFLHISTDEVFGSLDLNDPSFTEETSYKPNSPYSASKAASDHLVKAWYKTYNLPAIITNCSNNYGPNQNNEKFIPKIINNALKKQPIPIYGNGKNIRDWLYVEDHCKAIIKILRKGKVGETYNIGGSNEKENIQVVCMICEILEELLPFSKNRSCENDYSDYKDLITYVDDRPGHDLRYSIDSSKILRELNWQPNETFDSGIKKTIKWYLKNLNLNA